VAEAIGGSEAVASPLPSVLEPSAPTLETAIHADASIDANVGDADGDDDAMVPAPRLSARSLTSRARVERGPPRGCRRPRWRRSPRRPG
jgi:hypothetical protein